MFPQSIENNINALMSSFKVPDTVIQFLLNLELLDRFMQRCSISKKRNI
jgi:hypothetical protein